MHAWRVYRLDKNTGEILWERTAHEGAPRVKRHPKATQANPTPATDGKRVVVFFGSEGLYCYDFSGKLLWKKDLGVLDAAFFQEPDRGWGFASSPIIHGNVVFVQCDIIEGSFLAAFDLEDGRELWRTPRDDVPIMEYAHRSPTGRSNVTPRQRMEAHRGIRRQNRKGDLATSRWRRHPGSYAGRGT